MRFLRYVNRPDPQFEVALLVAVARSVARDQSAAGGPKGPVTESQGRA